MDCERVLRIAAGCAVILLARGIVQTAEKPMDDVKKVRFAPQSFYRSYLAPRMDSRLQAETAAAVEYVSPGANPWTRDHATVERIQASAIKAGKKALKRYVLDGLKFDSWSIPLFATRKGASPADVDVADSRARLRFGMSHLAPRAELMIPVNYGRVGLRADARGAMDCSFESKSSTFRFDVSVDPREHTGTFTIGRRF